MLATHGVVFHDPLAELILELLAHEDWKYRLGMVDLFFYYFRSALERRDQAALDRIVESIELVAGHLRDGKEYDPNARLAAQYVREARERGEEPTKEGLLALMNAQHPRYDEGEVYDDSYAYELLRRVGRKLLIEKEREDEELD